MGRTYILAFGGTGAKVMESVVMLMAAGAFGKKEIVPLLIDLDSENGNIHKCVRLMDLYAEINRNIYQNMEHISHNSSFFGTPLRKVMEIELEQPEEFWKGEGSDWLVYGSNHQREEYAMLQSLCQYNAENSRSNVNSLAESLFGRNFEYNGFFEGWPGAEENISVTHMRYGISGILDDVRIKEMIRIIGPTDRVVIVGSTFGDTGRVGILELLKIFKNHWRLGEAYKAFVLVNPYFPCHPEASQRDISESFKDKTVEFYDAYDRFDDVAKITFKINPTASPVVWKQVSDGHRQANTSTPTELMAAIAINSFVTQSTFGKRTVDCTLREGKRDNIHELIETSPSLRNTADVSGDLGWFSIFAYCTEREGFLEKSVDSIRRRRVFPGISEPNERFISRIKDFNRNYINWWEEMTANGGGNFRIFDFNANMLNRLIAGKLLPPYGLFAIMRMNAYTTLYGDFEKEFQRIYEQSQSYLCGAILAAFRSAAENYTQKPFRPVQ